MANLADKIKYYGGLSYYSVGDSVYSIKELLQYADNFAVFTSKYRGDAVAHICSVKLEFSQQLQADITHNWLNNSHAAIAFRSFRTIDSQRLQVLIAVKKELTSSNFYLVARKRVELEAYIRGQPRVLMQCDKVVMLLLFYCAIDSAYLCFDNDKYLISKNN